MMNNQLYEIKNYIVIHKKAIISVFTVVSLFAVLIYLLNTPSKRIERAIASKEYVNAVEIYNTKVAGRENQNIITSIQHEIDTITLRMQIPAIKAE